MALLEDAIGGWGGGFLSGLGAAFILPVVLPAAGGVLRPFAKTLVKGALLITDGAKGIATEATEQFSDLVAEVRAERGTEGDGSAAPKHRTAASQH